MYLEGREYVERCKWERFELISSNYDLGYWRKHANLHGFIVENFAEGIDDQKPIYLGADDIHRIIKAIEEKQLPHTTGFFFGESQDTPEQIAYDIEIFTDALKWMADSDRDGRRAVYYSAWW